MPCWPGIPRSPWKMKNSKRIRFMFVSILQIPVLPKTYSLLMDRGRVAEVIQYYKKIPLAQRVLKSLKVHVSHGYPSVPGHPGREVM